MSTARDASPLIDFPFYAGKPVGFTTGQWAIILVAVALGFALLVAPVPWYANRFGQFVPAILFAALPLAALAWVTPAHWTALFRKVGIGDVGWMVFFAVLNFAVTFAVGYAVMKWHGAHANPATSLIANMSGTDLVLWFAKTVPQLLGEELVTIVPMLALMTFLHVRLKWSRMASIVTAWVATAVMFGALHLPTYSWDFMQCIVIIGSARMLLTLAYLKTKNLWVSTGAHIINDWSMFAVGLMGVGAHVQ